MDQNLQFYTEFPETAKAPTISFVERNAAEGLSTIRFPFCGHFFRQLFARCQCEDRDSQIP
jgi:hypothetical protein